MLNTKKISVIVPVYNVELYLRDCLDSLIVQTYRNLEIILVDDGSADNCPGICDEYAFLDERIRVIHKKNGGLSDARNAGLDIATGDYISFVDSDDWVSPTMYEDLINTAVEYSAELVCCNYLRVEDKILLNERKFGVKRCVSGSEILRDILCQYSDNVVVWNKLYDSILFKDVRFPLGEIHEDNAILCSTIGKVSVAAYTGTVGYYYRIRSGSIMNSSSFDYHNALLIRHLSETELFIKTNYPDLCECFHNYNANILAYLLHMCYDNGIAEESIEFKSIKTRLTKNLAYYLKNTNISIKNKIEAVLMCMGVYRPVKKVWRKTKSIVAYFRNFNRNFQSLWHFIRYIFETRRVQVILFNSPLHGNIGDHAIAIAETEFLASLGISVLDYPWGKNSFKLLAKVTPKNKVVLITGGGYMGDLWPEEEDTVRNILETFCNHHIIVMPQTVHFDTEAKDGKQFFESSKQIYSKHPSFTLFVREKISYEFMMINMPLVHIEIVPDMVMLCRGNMGKQRKGVLVCLRNDKERTLSVKEKSMMLALLNKTFNLIKIIDMVEGNYIPLSERKISVNRKLAEFSSSELVITDRLHGMIFAAVTETPCIVLNSRSHKIKGCYEWLKDLDYIRFVDDIKNIPQVIDVLRSVDAKYKQRKIDEAMQPLKQELKKWINN